MRYLMVLLLLLVLDIPFIYIINNVYKNLIGPIKFSNRVVLGAAFVYMLLALGIVSIAYKIREPTLAAFIIGLVAYGTYSFTSYAIYPDWPLWLAVSETLWGGILLAMTTYISLTLKI